MTHRFDSEAIQTAIAGKTPDAGGEIRADCPKCDGGQRDTLGVNVNTGAFHCFRCDLRGNLKENRTDKKPLAQFLNDQARPVNTHPYAEKKQIRPNEIRQDQHGNWIIPFTDQAGRLQTIQFIKPEKKHGEKDKFFLSKAKNNGVGFKGAVHIIEGRKDLIIWCEGIATGWSIHLATGATVYCCGSKDNLDPVMAWSVGRYPDSKKIVAGDNDKSGDGQRVGAAAARKYNILFACPGVNGDFNDMAIDASLDAVKSILENAQKPGPDAETTGPRFKLVKYSDIKMKPADWLIYQLFERDSLNLLFSDPGGAKTFLAIDVACCVATGKDFHGRVSQQGPIVYIAGEGQNGMKRRFMAWGIRHQVDLEHAPIFLSLMPAGLCDADQVDFIIEAVQAVAEEYGPPGAIFLDTVARNFGPGDENSTKDMTAFIAGADKIREKFRSCVLLIHHSGHADKSRGRGSMALKGALDTEYRLEKDETGVIRVTNTKMKEHQPPEPMAFRLRTVDLPFTDDQGNAVTSAILDDTEYQPPACQGKKGRGKWQTVSIEVLKKIFLDQQKNLESGGYDPDQARVTLDDWRTACIDNGMNREAWRRIKDNLSQNPDVEQDGIYVFPC
jgi:hypothetical protein